MRIYIILSFSWVIVSVESLHCVCVWVSVATHDIAGKLSVTIVLCIKTLVLISRADVYINLRRSDV